MRLLLLALLVVTAAGLRQKRTLGVIFRGLVDANARQVEAVAKRDPVQAEKLRSPPPPPKIYLIPIPERDKKSHVQLFNTPIPPTIDRNFTKDPSYNEVKLPLNIVSRRNSTLQGPKQFLIRISNEEGKTFMMRITGDDVQVRKNRDGYMIGVVHNNAKANINIELPEKLEVNKSEKHHTNFVDKYQLPFYPSVPTDPSRIEQLEKNNIKSEKLGQYPFSQLAAYPYPVLLPSQFLPTLPLGNQLNFEPLQFPLGIERPRQLPKDPKVQDKPKDKILYSTNTEKPQQSALVVKSINQYSVNAGKSAKPEKYQLTLTGDEEKKLNITNEKAGTTHLQLTVRLKGEPSTTANVIQNDTEKPPKGQQVKSAQGNPPSRPPNHPGQYPISYPGQYSSSYPGQYPISYPSQYPISYPGQNPSGYQGQYPLSSPGQYPLSSPGQYPLSSPGQYPLSSPGQYPLSSSGQYPLSSPGQYQTSFTGQNSPSNQGAYPYSNTGPYPSSYATPTPPASNPSQSPPYQEPDPIKYQQWFLQPPPQQGPTANQNPQPNSQELQSNWNVPPISQYNSYLQDTLAPPYSANDYTRVARKSH